MARDRETSLREALVVEPPPRERVGADSTRLDLALEELRRVRTELDHAGAEAEAALLLLERARDGRGEAAWDSLASTCGVLDQRLHQLADDTSELLDDLTTLAAPHMLGARPSWPVGEEVAPTDMGALFEEDPRDLEIERLRGEITRLQSALDNASARVLQGGIAHVIGALQPDAPRAEPARSPFDRLSVGASVRELLTVLLSAPDSREVAGDLRTLHREIEAAMGQAHYLVWDDFVCERSEVSNRREEAALQAGAPYGVLLGLVRSLHPELDLAELADQPERLQRIAAEHGANPSALHSAPEVLRQVAESDRQGRLSFSVDETLRDARVAAIGGASLAEAELHLEDVALEVGEALEGPWQQRWTVLRQQLRVRARAREDAAFQAGVQLGIPIGCAAALFPGEPVAAVFSSPERADQLLSALGYRLEQLPALAQLTLRTVFQGDELV